MKHYLNIAIAFMLACIMASCSEEVRTTKKDRSAGGTAEIMVVVQNDDQWNGRIGDSLRHFLWIISMDCLSPRLVMT